MNYKRKVKVNKEKLYNLIMNKSCRLSLRKICIETKWNYDTARHALMDGEIMPDTLLDIANYLNVKVEELQ